MKPPGQRKPSDEPQAVKKRVRKCRAKKRQAAQIRADEEDQLRTSRPICGIFHDKLMQIVAIYPSNADRNKMIEENSRVIKYIALIDGTNTVGINNKAVINQRMGAESDQYLIQVNVSTTTMFPRWVDWFVVKKSSLPGAGMGLFAARNFEKNESIGVYAGKYIGPCRYLDHRSEYYIQNSLHQQGIDGCPWKYGKPIHFAIHIANDAHLGLVVGQNEDWYQYEQISPDGHPYNFKVKENFVAVTTKAVQMGEELYLYYGWSKSHEDED